ncbi:hypothetical protein DAEQUDRAFT_730004 [Daedalea quercina L-15889]|uniref:Uncharacterized protein n=1 Tax=Daedalea quercina L-15889 TaxID=1314783 RepID=A0A165N6W2_9APHY|nr:hypothetical protein DAEQUDRAFT_730004 [Daedalea quercina L-15889]
MVILIQGSQNTTCCYPGCQKGVWQNPDGSYSAFCSKKHRDAMTVQQQPWNGLNAGGTKLCKNCRSRPGFVEGSRVHDFCGMRCRIAYQSGGNQATGGQVTELCLLCGLRPKVVIKGKLSDFCSNTCKEDTFKSAPLILSIGEEMASFKDVSKQFLDSWKHKKALPSVVKIWKIYCNKSHTDNFFSYKGAIERKIGQTGGNSRRRWHGTSRTCTIGDSEDQTNLCQDVACSLCRIIETSFDINK